MVGTGSDAVARLLTRDGFFWLVESDGEWLFVRNLEPGLVTERMNWLADPPADGTHVHVRIRYNHAGIGATVHSAEGGAIEVRFDEPQAAVTPGQLAVLDDGARCLGGAPIARALGMTQAPATAGIAVQVAR